MALIKCRNCGHQISDKATVCPKCGTPTKEEPEKEIVRQQDSKANEEMMYLTAMGCLDEGRLDEARDYVTGLLAQRPDEPRYQELQSRLDEALQRQAQQQALAARRRRRTGWGIGIIAVLLLLAAGGYWYYERSQQQSELELWSQIQATDEPALIENYLQRYPDGEHRAQAEEQLSYVREQADEWQKIAELGNADELEKFYKKYEKGRYHDMAVAAYDDLLWTEATTTATPEGYAHYMQRCPQGSHYAEAKELAARLEKVRLTDDEAATMSSTVRQFFYAVARGDENEMLALVAPQLDSFLGKNGATKVDVVAYMRRLHADDVFSVDLTMGDINVSKALGKDDAPVYTATFTFDQRISREDTSQETFASYKGTARLSGHGKITSLSPRTRPPTTKPMRTHALLLLLLSASLGTPAQEPLFLGDWATTTSAEVKVFEALKEHRSDKAASYWQDIERRAAKDKTIDSSRPVKMLLYPVWQLSECMMMNQRDGRGRQGDQPLLLYNPWAAYAQLKTLCANGTDIRNANLFLTHKDTRAAGRRHQNGHRGGPAGLRAQGWHGGALRPPAGHAVRQPRSARQPAA